MLHLADLLPKLEQLGHVAYLIIFGITILESTAFIGLAVPGTTVVVFAGFLASQKIIDLGDTLWVVALGGIIGDGLSFILGRKGINFFRPDSRFFKPAHLEMGEKFFRIHGNKSVFLARFIGPIRPIIPFVAGLTQMPRGAFFAMNVTGGIVSAIVYVLFGYFFGNAWPEIRHALHRLGGELVILVAVLVSGYVVRNRFFKNFK